MEAISNIIWIKTKQNSTIYEYEPGDV